MLWLYILSGIAAVIAGILLTPVKLRIRYKEALECFFYIGFIRFRLYPAKPEKKKKSAKKKKTDGEKKAEKKKEEKKPSLLEGKGLSEITDLLKQIAELTKGVLKDFFGHIIIKNFSLSIKLAGDDAADTAIKYGTCCSVIYPLVSTILFAAKCRHYGVDITPDFDEKAETQTEFHLFLKIRIVWLLALVVNHGPKALKILTDLNVKGE